MKGRVAATGKGRGRGSAANGAKPMAKGKGKGKAASESEDEGLDEPSGLTSDEDDSDLSEASSAFEPEDEAEDEVEAISVGDSDVSDDIDAPPRKKARAAAASSNAKGKGKGPSKVSTAGGDRAGTPPGGKLYYNDNGRMLKATVSGNGRRVTALGEELSDDDDVDLEDGQEIVGRIYPAPKNGRGESARATSKRGETSGQRRGGTGDRGARRRSCYPFSLALFALIAASCGVAR